MSDIAERLRRGHHNADLITVGGVTHDGRCLVAADEITRLRADLAAAQEQADRYLRHLTAGAQKIREVGSALAAAQEREQSRALPADDAEMVERLREKLAERDIYADARTAREILRAALSAMRGEP